MVPSIVIYAIAWLGIAGWTYLLFFHNRFWYGRGNLPRDLPKLKTWPSVVAVVPARDEAPTIRACVKSLMAQNYPGIFSVIFVDDASTDGTGDIVRSAIEQNEGSRTQIDGSGGINHTIIIPAPPLTDGWTGKLSALNAGLSYTNAHQESPEYIWFTDADVVHPPKTLSRLIAKAVHERLDLTSLMVRLRCISFWERLLIPTFIYFFQMLFYIFY